MVADARVAVADVKTPRRAAARRDARRASRAPAPTSRTCSATRKGDFRDTVANLKESTGTIKEKLPPTMDNLRETTGTLKEKLPGTMDAAKAFIVRLDDTVKNTEGTLADVKATMANFKDISAERARSDRRQQGQARHDDRVAQDHRRQPQGRQQPRSATAPGGCCTSRARGRWPT